MSSLTKQLDQCKAKKLNDKVRQCKEYEEAICKLFDKNENGCLFSLTQTKAELETRKCGINLIGNGIILFVMQIVIACAFILFTNQSLPDIVIKPLLFMGLFFIGVLFLIYILMLRGYRADNIKFEIQNRVLEEKLL